MRDLFAVDDPAADPSYLATRRAESQGAARGRANCDDLWRDFERLASSHFLSEFPYHFHHRWFEMYVAVALMRSGLDVTSPAGGTPDVRVQLGDDVVWIEATGPGGGDSENPDRVERPVYSRGNEVPSMGRVPTEQIILRVRHGLHEKAKKIRAYRDRGVIGPRHQAIVAISVNGIPHGFFDAERYGLGAVYGLGDPYVVIDRKTLKKVDEGIAHRGQIRRQSGTLIDVAPFLHPGHEHVNGALISGTDAFNCAPPLGRDFMLLPNPNAAPPWVDGQIKLGREWRLRPAEQEAVFDVEVVQHS